MQTTWGQTAWKRGSKELMRHTVGRFFTHLREYLWEVMFMENLSRNRGVGW